MIAKKSKKKTGKSEQVASEQVASENGTTIKILTQISSLHGSFNINEIATVPKNIADDWINCGYAEKAGKKKIETATQI